MANCGGEAAANDAHGMRSRNKLKVRGPGTGQWLTLGIDGIVNAMQFPWRRKAGQGLCLVAMVAEADFDSSGVSWVLVDWLVDEMRDVGEVDGEGAVE
jgi:hypothetical protein